MAILLACAALAMFLMMASGMMISLSELGRKPAYSRVQNRDYRRRDQRRQ